MAETNWDLLSIEDLQAYTQDRFDDMSEDSLRYISGEGWGTGESLLANMSQGVTSSLRAIAGMTGNLDEEADVENERRARMMLETNPIAGWAGLITGSILDPVTLPAAVLKPLGWAAKGALAGATGGALEPVYEEFGDSRVMNILAGAGLGAGIGAALGKLLGRGAKKAGTEAEAEAEKILKAEDTGKAVDEAVNADGAVAKTADEVAPKIPENATFNPQTKQFEVEEEVAPTVSFNLPRNIAGAKPRFNQFNTSFGNDLDKALYIIGKGTTKSAKHQEYVDWVKRVTGLSDEEVRAAARTAREELVKKFAVGEIKGNTIAAEPSTVSLKLIETASAPKKVAKPVKPEVTIKDGLDEEDLKVLERAGVKVVFNRNGTINFREIGSPKFITNAEFMARMEAAGIAIDLPAYRARTKAAVQAQQEAEAAAMGRAAGDQPEVTPESQQFWSGIPPVNKQQWTTPPAGKAAPETDRAALEAMGAPVEQRSVGAKGVKPADVYASELLPGVDRMPPTEMMNRLLSMDINEVIKMLPPQVQAELASKHPKGLVGYMEEGMRTLQKIRKNHGNIVNWMLYRSKDKHALSEDEVGAFAPFYWHAKKSLSNTLDKALDHRAAGGGFVDGVGADLARDLHYYQGIMMFKQNQGSKAGRSLNAYNLLSEKIRNNKTVQNMFPGVLC